jgi:hypothetical protein
MSKLPSVLTDKQSEQYIDNSIPHYKDKEITFWSMNRDKGNMYSSHAQGINVFNKTHGFTQPINNSKSVLQFNQNITNNIAAKNVYFNPNDNQFVEGFLEQKRLDAVFILILTKTRLTTLLKTSKPSKTKSSQDARRSAAGSDSVN